MSHERRVFVGVPGGLRAGAEVSLGDSDSHHLRDVLRLKTGDPVVVVETTTGQVFEGFLVSLNSPVIAKISSEISASPDLSVVRGLLFALCRGKTNEYVAEKATELGVEFIIFWMAERSVVRLGDSSDSQKKVARLEKICEAASKQSGRGSIPKVYVVSSLEAAWEVVSGLQAPGDRFFVGSLAEDARKLSSIAPLKGFAHCIIGPEGDFSPAEESFLRTKGGELFSLGLTRLRAETAACASLTALDMFAEMSKGRVEKHAQ